MEEVGMSYKFVNCIRSYTYFDKLFTYIIVLFPILSLYGVNLFTFTLGDVLLICLIILYIIMGVIHNRINVLSKDSIFFPLVPFFLYIVFQFFIIQSLTDSRMFILIGLRTFRYLTYVGVVIFLFKKHFQFLLGLKIYRNVAIFASLYLFIQLFLLNIANFYLTGYLPFLPILREGLEEFSTSVLDARIQRPRSIFAEPAHYAVYVLGALTLELFRNRVNNKKSIIVIILLTIGIIASASSTGILILPFIFLIWLLKIKNFSLRGIVYFQIILLFLILYLRYSPQILIFLQRMLEGTSTAGRFSGYDYIKEVIYQSDLINIIFGFGMIDMLVYTPSYVRMIIYFGFLGTFLFFVGCFLILIKRNQYNRMLLTVFLILGIGTVIILGRNLLLYFAFIISSNGYTLNAENQNRRN